MYGHCTLFYLTNLKQGYYKLLTYCPRHKIQLPAGLCAHDRCVLWQLALNVHVKPNWLDMTWPTLWWCNTLCIYVQFSLKSPYHQLRHLNNGNCLITNLSNLYFLKAINTNWTPSDGYRCPNTLDVAEHTLQNMI